MRSIVVTVITIFLASKPPARAECPLDHFIIGCNRDGSVDLFDFARMAANRRIPSKQEKSL